MFWAGESVTRRVFVRGRLLNSLRVADEPFLIAITLTLAVLFHRCKRVLSWDRLRGWGACSAAAPGTSEQPKKSDDSHYPCSGWRGRSAAPVASVVPEDSEKMKLNHRDIREIMPLLE